jgi:hypothetical protein
MSISTYAELTTAVTNWLHRDDLSSYTADFVTLGEARIAREVRAQVMEQRATSTLSDSSAYINVPSDLIEWRALWLQTSPKTKLEYLPPEAFFERYPDTDSSTGQPVAYTIIGDELRFGPPPNSAYTIELWYFKKLTALSSSTNILFTGNPDLYLYAALSASQPFLKDDKRIATWEALYKQVRDQVNDTERNKRYGSGLRINVV